VNEIQEKAHSLPCFEPQETMNPRFKHYEEHGHYLVSVILTANIGME
jgi:hypothetical protein